MSLAVWPFLVGCNKTLGYQVIVSPQFLSDSAQSYLLFQATGENDLSLGSVTAREIHGSEIGKITIVYHVIRPQSKEYDIDEEGSLRDKGGRPIRLFEGLVIRGGIDAVRQAVLLPKDLLIAHEQVRKAYTDFWAANTNFAERISQPFSLQTSEISADKIDLVEEPPLQIPRSSAHNILIRHSSINSDIFRSLEKYTPSRKMVRIPILVLIVLTSLIIITGTGYWLISSRFGLKSMPTPSHTILPNGLGVTLAPDGQYIGLNDGSFYPFDVFIGRNDIQSKIAAAQALQNHDQNSATVLLEDGLTHDTNDAEASIYLENLRAVASDNYYTLVVAINLLITSPDTPTRSILQGAYTAQKEYNNNPNHSLKLRLLIANSGSNNADVTFVAQQIVRVSKQEHILAVIGWPTTAACLNATPVLSPAKIPLISQNASSDTLSAYSPYFFRIVPPNKKQAQTAVSFITAPIAQNGLHAKNVVVFRASDNEYSTNIATDFERAFNSKTGNVPTEETFPAGKTDSATFVKLIQKSYAENAHADVYYFASPSHDDALSFQKAVSLVKALKLPPIVSVDDAYVVTPGIYGNWYFTTFAYPDEWSIVTHNSISLPPFFTEYRNNFDPNKTHNNIYSYSRPDSKAIISYDATNTVLDAIQNTKKENLLPQDIADILPVTTLQGISGYIAFDAQHDPQDKTIVLLSVSARGPIQLKCVSGTFFPGNDQSQSDCPI